MKQAFVLQGVDCALCASKIEGAVCKLEGVRAASVSFLTGKMTIEGEDARMEEIAREAQRIAVRIEPGVRLKRA